MLVFFTGQGIYFRGQLMFIGRKNELRLLNDLINANRPTIGVIYGRRRVGKSELIKKAFENQRVLIFEGLENRSCNSS
jgi:AAA+ ATPase superfamily predicted ATPase